MRYVLRFQSLAMIAGLAIACGCGGAARAPAPTAEGHAGHHRAAEPSTCPHHAKGDHSAGVPHEGAAGVHAEHAQAQVGAHGPVDHGPRPDGEYKVADAHHRFDDPERWARAFESEARDKWQRGDAVIAALAIARDARVADIGSATGYFSVRFARAAPQGRIFGLDIEPGMVKWLADRATREGLTNLSSVLVTPADPKLPEAVDLLFVSNTYHHIRARVAYFDRLAAQTRPGARLVIVDFKMGDIPVGPPASHRIPPEVITAELAQAGWKLERRDDALLPYQHLLVYRRAAAGR